jgi:hypothetical protein
MTEHDIVAQKFNQGDGFLAYTMMNDYMDLYMLFAESEKEAEELALAAFEYARKNGLKVVSSSEHIDKFIDVHPEFSDIVKKDFFS